VGCVVLGAGADDATVAHWLRQAAGVEGFIGFAIGRTIFWDALRGWLDGRIDREGAVREIAANYRATVELYAGAAVV
jgi:myo-inositol catabolism protein IolC